MDDPSITGFKERYDEFSKLDDKLLGFLLDDSMSECSQGVFGRHYLTAVYALCAHFAYMRGKQMAGDRDGTVGSVTERGVASVHIGYSGSKSKVNLSDELLMGSSYGIAYLRLRNMVTAGMMGVSRF